jgi:hypothetical protein
LAWPLLAAMPTEGAPTMESTDLTLEFLKSIRDETRGTNVRLDDAVHRLDDPRCGSRRS